MIQRVERALILLLNFRMNIPTPVDFIQYFLYLSNPAFDFSTMISESLPYAYVALIGK